VVNEVKELCDLALDVPAPPLPPAADVLSAARRAAARRTGMAVAGYGLAVAAVVAAGARLAVPGLAGRGAGGRARPGGSGAPAAAAPGQPPPAPDVTTAAGHAPAITRVLLDAVPAGYTGRPDEHGTGLWLRKVTEGGYVLLTRVFVSAGGGDGTLDAIVTFDGQPVPAGDLCGADVAARLGEPAGVACETVVVNGVPVRVTTEHDAERGEVKGAARFLSGGLVRVTSAQGVADYHPDDGLPPDAHRSGGTTGTHRPPLAAPAFSSAQVAAIAANPALLP